MRQDWFLYWFTLGLRVVQGNRLSNADLLAFLKEIENPGPQVQMFTLGVLCGVYGSKELTNELTEEGYGDQGRTG